MDRKKIEEIIKIYLSQLSQKIRIEKAILFGSALRGKIDPNSDIDLLILSPSFAKMATDERLDLLYTSRTNPLTQNVAMDIFGLTPKEYREASGLSIVGEIKEKGREISLL
jgi:predicted nucleotidyltransferase